MATLSRSHPTARRPHRCGSCDGPILPGERYHRWTGTADEWDGLATLKECAGCAERYGRMIQPASPRKLASESSAHSLTDQRKDPNDD